MTPVSPQDFVHLHVHTEYSLLDGFCRLGPMMGKAKKDGHKAIAVTDHGYLYAGVEFYKAAKKAEVKPIFGCEVYVAPGRRTDRGGRSDNPYFHMVLLAKDYPGYQNLMRIISTACVEGFYYKPRADFETLQKYSEGIVATSACLRGEIPMALAKGDYDGAKAIAGKYREVFGPDSFYLEIMDHGMEDQKRVNRELIRLAKDTGIGLVATNDVHYLNQEDSRAHDVLMCIGMGRTLEDKSRMRFGSDQFYFKSGEEMMRLFGEVPESIANTARIAEMCNVDLDLKTYHLPAFPVDQEQYPGYTEADLMEQLCRENLPRCYGDNPPPEVLERLDYELSVIKQMGFPAYFLIIWDFMRFAKSHDIPVGPGRGSAAGSVVAYLLGITELDPLEFKLIFERFLNPSRKEMPDVDSDFCVDRRGEVIEYVREKYGSDRVCQIVTFGRLKARASIRDVGRVLDFPLAFVDRVAKTVPAGPKVTLKSALEESPDFLRLYQENDDARKIIDLARELEGVPRNASIHAAGVIISANSLPNYVPLQKMNDKDIVAQFEMGPVAEIGLLKMDFLGLRNLTVIKHCTDIIKKRHGIDLDLNKLPRDDPKVFELLQNADTTGIFQFESSGMRRYLRQLKPDRFADIVAMVALYRPGPIQGGMVEKYINRRHGREEIDYPHPSLEPILKETYGIILYQEQVMQIANVMGGYTMAKADELRKAMGKKKADLMAEHRRYFTEGSVKNGIDEKLAIYVWDLMETFAGYGFNKSHSAAYGIVTYYTAWLKAHYPWEYQCALMTSVMDKIDKVSFFVAEARNTGIPVLPPDVNESEAKFTVVDAGVRFGMGAVRNVGLGAIEAIVAARREGGAFTSLFDFCTRVDAGTVNKRVSESLIKAGAMDCFNENRATLLANLDPVLEAATRKQRERNSGQIGLFDAFEDEEESSGVTLVEQCEFDKPVMLAMEKEMLGLYLSDSPLSSYEHLLTNEVFTPIQRFGEHGADAMVLTAGVVVSMRTIITKTKTTMAFLQIEDTSGSCEVTVFPRTYDKCKDALHDDAMIAVKGKLEARMGGRDADEDEEAPAEELKILADTVVLLDDLTVEKAVALHRAPPDQPPSKWPRRERPAAAPEAPKYKPPPGSSATEDWASRADDRLDGAPEAAAPTTSRYKPPPGSSATEDWASRADDRLDGDADEGSVGTFAGRASGPAPMPGAAPVGGAGSAVGSAPATGSSSAPRSAPATGSVSSGPRSPSTTGSAPATGSSSAPRSAPATGSVSPGPRPPASPGNAHSRPNAQHTDTAPASPARGSAAPGHSPDAPPWDAAPATPTRGSAAPGHSPNAPPWDAAPAHPGRGLLPGVAVHIRLDLSLRDRLPALRQVIERHRGEEAVYLHFESSAGHTLMALDDRFRVQPNEGFLREAERLLGAGSVYSGEAPAQTRAPA